MAERGAHLTSAVLDSDSTSVFQVLAQESLMRVVRPAFKHAVKVFSERKPEKFGWMLQFFDEIYAAFDFVVENYYLKKYNASFAENFYGLQRVAHGKSPEKALPSGVHWKSVMALIFMPYICEKWKQMYEASRLHMDSVPARNQSYLQKLFVGFYPYIHTVWQGAVLGYHLAYMFGKSCWHTPNLHLTGVELRNISDYVIDEHPLSGQVTSFQSRLVAVVRRMLDVIAKSLSSGLSLGIFFLQFLDYWYSNSGKSSSLTALPIPQPPQESVHDYLRTTCPVCKCTRTNDTALSVSGLSSTDSASHSFVSSSVLNYRKAMSTIRGSRRKGICKSRDISLANRLQHARFRILLPPPPETLKTGGD